MAKVDRVWRYRYGDWTPRWWEWVIPARLGDEYGRRTLVIHVPLLGFLVWAYRTCWCEGCQESRRITDAWTRRTAEQMELDELAFQERQRWKETT